MKLIIGFVMVIASVLGGYVLSHGKVMALWQPFELLIIGGSALGAFIISNPGYVIKACFGSIGPLLSGSKYNKAFYLDLLGFDVPNIFQGT